MATKRVVVLVCDLCSTEGETVSTRTVAVDRRHVEVESCTRCWTRAEKVLVPILDAGRRVRKSPRRSTP